MKGIITKAVGGFFFVADNKGKIHQTNIRGKITERVYPGDNVEFVGKIIEKVYPRNNLLYRPNVANVDQVLIIQSITHPPFDRKLLDRFLVMVEAANLKPVIILNKIDLGNSEELKEIFEDYLNADYQVFFISVKKGLGLNNLMESLSGKINVLTGPSGVGKSSLINSLITGADLATGKISYKLKRGIHTTRHVELLAIEEGGWIADTPGFTSLDIKHIFPEELTFLFPEFKPYIGDCKFRSCSHTHEPKCAVKEAVNNGFLSKKRYDSYCSFYQELID